MKTSLISSKKRFLENLQIQFQEFVKTLAPVRRIMREKAWDQFLELGLPDRKQAGFEYIPLQQLYEETFTMPSFPDIDKNSFSSLIFPECKRQNVVFVNGQYMPRLSDTSGLPKEVLVLTSVEAMQKYAPLIQRCYLPKIKQEIDPFHSMNMALVPDGLMVIIPPKVVLRNPIQCLHIIVNDHPIICSPRTHIFLSEMSKVQWISTMSNLKDCEYFFNGGIDFVLEEGAQADQMQIINPDKHGYYFEVANITLKRNTQFKHVGVTTGAKAVRHMFRTEFLGENASCDLKGLMIVNENKQAHVNVLMEHKAPHCQSMQLFKNILQDTSKSSFEGKIYIHPKAQKTQAYQLNKNLLLNVGAIANSKPNLEIFADDVKASHGATVTQFQNTELFYLKSRGIPEHIAKKLLLTGFSLEILQNIPVSFVHDYIQNNIVKKLLV